MKISVITPVLNGGRFIRKTVESVLGQQGDFELEYIICDGESTDNTLSILEEYKDRCTIISRKDGSPQEAINRGMSLATGDVACWLNADDVFTPGALEIVASAFKKNPLKHWLYGRCRIINENDVEIRKPITWYKNVLGFFFSRHVLLCENFINQPATFWRLGFWRQVCDLKTKYKAAWDYELWVRMAAVSSPVHIRRYLSEFRRHDESISENHFEKQFQEELAIAGEHGGIIHRIVHTFNVWKIVAIYKLLGH